MTKTTNFQLNQWDGDDRIMREDFNADNAKIDAAIAAGCRMIKLREIVTAQTAHQVDLDVSDIVWGRWQEVILDITNSDWKCFSLFVCKNDTLYGTHETPGFLNTSPGLFCANNIPSGAWIRARFPVFRSAAQPVSSITYLGSQVQFGSYATEAYASAFSAGKLSLCGTDSNHNVPAGTTLVFYGVNA